MFKFIHAADIHLDSPLCGLGQYDGAPVEEIRLASRKALENLVKLALEEKVKFVLIAGDLYDGDWKDYNTGLFFSKQMLKLREAGITVYLVSGNHDAASRITKSLHLPENVFQFSTRAPETKLIEEIGVAIHGQGFSSRAVTDDLSLKYPDAVRDYFNIGLLHTCATGREGYDTYAPCTLEGLIAKNYNYWALGHVHKREVLCEKPWVLFPGNIQGRNVRETGAKGCFLVTMDDSVTVEHRTLDIMRWDICKVNGSGTELPEDILVKVKEQIQDKIDHSEGRPLALRVHIFGECGAHEELSCDPEKWKNEVRALALDISSGQVWIEKIKIDTSSKVDPDELKNVSTPYRRIICQIEEFEPEAEAPVVEAVYQQIKARFDEELDILRKKLPYEAFQQESMLELNQPDKFNEIINKAKQLISSRLWTRREDENS